MTTLREQIEALGTTGSPLKVYRSDVLDIIDAHRCEPHTVITHIEAHIDRDALARVMHQTQIIGCIASDGWGRDCDGQCRDEADAIIAALENDDAKD